MAREVSRKAVDHGVTDAKRRGCAKSQQRCQQLLRGHENRMLRTSTRFSSREVTGDLNKNGFGGMMGQKAACIGLWSKGKDERSWRWFLQMTLSRTLENNEMTVAEPRGVGERGKKGDIVVCL